MVKKWLHTATVRVAIALLFAIMLVTFPLSFHKSAYDLPDGIAPGQPLADMQGCRPNYYEPIIDCQRGEYYYSVTPPDHLVTSVYLDFSNKDVTIGELIVSWGTPDGIDMSTPALFRVIYWGNKAAVSYSKFLELTPTSRVLGILWTQHRQKLVDWKGFYR